MGYMDRFRRGIDVNAETIAADLIKEVEPGDTFLDSMHTVQHFRQEMWFPTLLHRGTWDAWLDFGRRSPIAVAREQVDEYLSEDLVPLIDDDRVRDVDRVVEEAEDALLGHTTGILP